jgi:hypothetical protein
MRLLPIFDLCQFAWDELNEDYIPLGIDFAGDAKCKSQPPRVR